jgi:uncharacterized protein
MRIEDEFRVALPIEEAWKLLLDVERIAPCMPGAQLQEIEGDEYRGIVKVKVGPITAQYKGAAKITKADEAARRIVLDASGRDTRGQGNASAEVTIDMADDDGGTKVALATELNITGKVAQFGRGMMAEVSAKLLKQFVDNLERDVLSGGATASETATPAAAPATDAPAAATVADPTPAEPAPAASGTTSTSTPSTSTPSASASSASSSTSTSTAAGTSGVRKIDSKPAEPVDLVAVSGGSVAKRIAPLVGGGVLLLLLLRLLRRRKG